MTKICSTLNCGRPYHAKGLCSRYRHKQVRKENPNIDKQYEKTPKGFLMRTYRNMYSRVNGIQKNKDYLYKGLFLLEKEQFYNFSLNNEDFWNLYNIWTENNYNRKLSPSIDRIDSSKGYELNNIRWITHSENSRLGSLNQHNVKKPNSKRYKGKI